ncbi:hypothetical protein BWGOE8_50300 [Bacillus mycoides]|uniref:Metal-dependent hydrolase n=1 Tax=Bacillus mycoides TaxID=1405 RepID=A0A1E8AZW0_BACMY|nr:hypothetical protein BWGOE9_51350 [Bacillus mycoides]OFD71760.1 hypothetical protein BWGOE8_50300 [Bacillus mycoides]OFD74713.1 hypothetical protein BWGOE10_50920 [Bacillus mycoides]
MRFWGKRSGFVVGAVVFSHWILDLLVHRADLPLLPGESRRFTYAWFWIVEISGY